MPAATAPASPAARQAAAAQAPVQVPFTSAAHEHTEPAFDVTVTPGATAQPLGPFDIPAFGYMRHINLQVDGSGGTLGAGVLSADYPFNLFSSINLQDVNGANMYGPLDGFAALQTNIWGAYAGRSDPRVLPGFVGTINATFQLRVPVEVSHRDGFGSLANQNSAANYKFALIVNPTTILYSTAPTTPATFRIRGNLEAWTQPNETDMAGRRQAEVPPLLGTTQSWSNYTKNVAAGANQTLLTRVGNLIRCIVVIARTAGGVRQDNVFPDPAQLQWDSRILRNDTQTVLIQNMAESIPALNARDAGVFAYLFNDADHNMVGDDTPTLWLPTVQSTRMEIDGNSVSAGTLQIIINDIEPAEVRPEERYVETSLSGFHPAVGAAPPQAQ